MDFEIEAMRPDDWDLVRVIYVEGLNTGIATFETSAPGWQSWNADHLPCCRLVVRLPNSSSIAGWTALSPVSRRQVYAGVAEVSIYIAGWARGQGVGRALLAALISESERNALWTLQASIFAMNQASLALHRACGFREVGRRERIAQREGVWHDTIVLERRSPVVGR